VYSLHATKPFGVGEGAAIFAPHSKAERLRAALNFGLQTHTVVGTNAPPFWGINGKMSEFHAAIGLAVADKMEVRVAQRQAMAENWIKCLETTPVKILNRSVKDSTWQVFPILMDTNFQAERLVNLAKYRGIELRRYYSPSLGTCPGIRKLSPCPNAQSLADRVVVLPIRSLMEETLQQELMNEIRTCIMQIFESSVE
jgi:dTDP-4-amino-4,6-dideoxygalactose transaminase